MDALPQGGGNVHQRIEREARDPAAQQVVDPQLRHPATAGRLGLRPAAVANEGTDLAHQLGAQAKVHRFLGRVGQRIPHAGVAFHFGLGHLAGLVTDFTSELYTF